MSYDSLIRNMQAYTETYLRAFRMVMLGQAHVSFLIDRAELEKICLAGKLLELLSFLTWIATFQCDVVVFRTLNAVVCILNAKQVTILIVLNAKISIATTTVLNPELVTTVWLFVVAYSY